MLPNPVSSPVPPNATSNLMNLSVDELIAMLDKTAQEVKDAEPGTLPGGPDAEMPMMAPGASKAPAKVMPAGKNMTGMPAALVRGATAVLVDNGLLPVVQGQLDENLMDLLTQIANATAPGLYDLTDEQQVEELLRGLADGTIPVPPADQLNAGQQPVPSGAGLPGAGQPPAGLPGSGAGAGQFNPDDLL